MERLQLKYPILLLSILVMSCSQKRFDSEKELWAYVKTPENGYFHEKKVGQITYSLTYRPTDVMVKQMLPNDFSERTIDSLRNKYKDYLYFNLGITANNKEILNGKVGNRSAFRAMVNKLAFGMKENLTLIGKSRDTIEMLDYVYPRMYGMSNSTDMLLVYPKDNSFLKEEYFFFTIKDLGFATGEVAFKIKTKALSEEPRLNFNRTL
ncbi:hypothetical protein FGF1_14890 [Flavobacteriaceae bacterium GF1]